jgi:carbamoyltransferase
MTCRHIIGISAHFHNAACCLISDGRLVAAAEEERFSRAKHDAAIPRRAFRYCLAEGGISTAEVDCVAYYELPVEKLARQIWTMMPGLPADADLLARFDACRPEREIREVLGYDGTVVFVEHHRSHAASAFYFSGFPEAAILTVDGVGEWDTTTYGVGRGPDIDLFESVEFPDSLGLLYSTLTGYLGFEVNDGEYKVMGLAPYGEPRFADRIRAMVQIEDGGRYRLDRRFFDFTSQHRMYSDELIELLGHPPRQPGAELRQADKDLARSLQVVLEEVLLDKVAYLHERVPSEHLCMAGGVALNCVANARIRRDGPFKHLFVQPAAGDAGGALGAAATIWHQQQPTGRVADGGMQMRDAYFGPAFGALEIERLLEAAGIAAQDFRGREEDLLSTIARRLSAGEIVGWFHGRMEFGPRALGARSILADPRQPGMQHRLNAVIKEREAFRPFAPSVLLDRAPQHFDLDHAAPFMLETCQVRSSIDLPAITHVDGSARVQTVDVATSPRYARLIAAFERLTGCAILLNTSFNLNGEPIVCHPNDALICFLRSEMDALVLEDFVIDRTARTAVRQMLVRSVPPPSAAAVTHKTYTLL